MSNQVKYLIVGAGGLGGLYGLYKFSMPKKSSSSSAPFVYTGDRDYLKNFETKEFPTFPRGTKSLLSKFLSKEVWDKYQGKTDKYGFTIGNCINSGVKNPESGVGVYAGSEDSYLTFADLFDPIIEDYHMYKKSDSHKSHMDANKLKDLVDLDPDNKYILSTRIRVARNCENYPLGTAISKEERLDLESKIVDACKTFQGDLKGTYYKLGEMTEPERKQLVEDHFLFKEGDKYLREAGLNRDWPSGRGIFHNNNKTFLVWVNEEDQLRIISMQKGGDIRAVFERLARASAHIETKAKFAKTSHLGYITTCPTNLGTGLRASVHIKLPLLSQHKARFNEIADKYHVQIRGIHGEHSESEGGVFDISNKRRLGYGEGDLVRDMYNGVKAMLDAEKELEKKR